MSQDEIEEHFYELDWDGGRGWAHADALIKIGKPAVPYLIKALNKRYDDGMRARAAHALGEIGDPSAIKALTEALKDKLFDVHYEAGLALAKIGKLAVPYLIKALKGRSEIQRQYAADALGEIGDPSAIKALTKALEDKSYSVQGSARLSLRKLQGK